MRLHVLRKAPLSLLLLLAVFLLVMGCSDAGDDGGDSGVAVGDVDDVSLSGTVGTEDFSDNSGGPLPTEGDKNAALEAAFAAVGALGHSVGSFLEENPDWVEDQSTVSYTANPTDFEDWETASSVSLDATIDPTTMNLTSTGEAGSVTFEGNADMSASISTFSDDYDTYLDRLSGSLSVASLEVSASGVSSTDMDAPQQTVEAAKGFLELNANLDVIPSYDRSSGYAEMTQIDAAAAVSVAFAIAVSSTGSGREDGGNFIIDAAYTDSAELSITEALANDPEALEDYLDNRLDADAFSLRIRVYDGTTLRDDFTYTIDDIASFMASQDQE